MKKITCIVALSCAGFSFGSFDLMYLPDVGLNRVHRFDPLNRVYLGSFNSGTAQYIGAHLNSPYVVAGNPSQTTVHDATNGDYVNGMQFTNFLTGMDASGSMFGFTGSLLRQYSLPSGALLQSLSTGFTSVRGVGFFGTNRVVLGRNSASDTLVNVYTSAGALLSSVTAVTAAQQSASSTAASGLAVTTSSSGAIHIWFTHRSAAGAVRLERLDWTGTSLGTAVGTDLTGFSTLNTVSTQSVMAGHGSSIFVVGADATTPTLTRVQQIGLFGNASGVVSDGTTSAFSVPNNVVWAGANVIAPEPSSLLQLAAGASFFAALRRRKK